MLETFLEFGVSATQAGAKLIVQIDDQVVWQGDPGLEPAAIRHALMDISGDHRVEFVLSGKLNEHTVLDSNGNIVSDLLISIDNICLDGDPIDSIVHKIAVYEHYHNGRGSHTFDRFYGVMGCNGTASFCFSTPAYRWLLANV